MWREVMEGREVWQYGQLTMPESLVENSIKARGKNASTYERAAFIPVPYFRC